METRAEIGEIAPAVVYDLPPDGPSACVTRHDDPGSEFSHTRSLRLGFVEQAARDDKRRWWKRAWIPNARFERIQGRDSLGTVVRRLSTVSYGSSKAWLATGAEPALSGHRSANPIFPSHLFQPDGGNTIDE